ncbi:MAG: alpha/beta hydrolase fold domain-containing protein, partial [Rhodospirillaceae bacterium]|nr:alpha/beta hydrolase fold domain-containing protein [Rhodospirillaceae bacterium]
MAGPKIWLDYDQQELDDQYNQRTLVPDANDYMARHLELSKAVRTEHPCRLDLAYGPSEDEILDIFPAQNSPNGAAPCVVYYHGGAWTRWHKDYNSYQAPAFTGAGVTFISVNFALVPDVDLDELIRQCRAVVQWVHANAAEIG